MRICRSRRSMRHGETRPPPTTRAQRPNRPLRPPAPWRSSKCTHRTTCGRTGSGTGRLRRTRHASWACAPTPTASFSVTSSRWASPQPRTTCHSPARPRSSPISARRAGSRFPRRPPCPSTKMLRIEYTLFFHWLNLTDPRRSPTTGSALARTRPACAVQTCCAGPLALPVLHTGFLPEPLASAPLPLLPWWEQQRRERWILSSAMSTDQACSPREPGRARSPTRRLTWNLQWWAAVELSPSAPVEESRMSDAVASWESQTGPWRPMVLGRIPPQPPRCRTVMQCGDCWRVETGLLPYCCYYCSATAKGVVQVLLAPRWRLGRRPVASPAKRWPHPCWPRSRSERCYCCCCVGTAS